MKPPAVVTPVASAAHAFLAPSSADRWFYCSGSAWMESQFPDLSDPTASAEGDAAHWVMHQVLTTLIEARSMIGTHAPNGVLVTEAMVDAVELLRDDVAAKLGPQWREAARVEYRTQPIRRIHESACWGTVDVHGWGQVNSQWVLFVWDFKFGFKRVEVFENKQIVAYTAGLLAEYQIDGLRDQSTPCRLAICQPRAYHADGPLREWRVMASDLRALINQLSMAAEEATGSAPTCRPRASACENCRARAHCDALQEAAYRGMDLARQAIPRELSAEAAGLELVHLTEAAKLMEARLSGLEEVVKYKLGQGERVPHWRMAPGAASPKWNRSESEIAMLGRALGLDLTKPVDVITPTQAKAKGVPESLLKMYSTVPTTALKLTRDDGASVRRIFTQAP